VLQRFVRRLTQKDTCADAWKEIKAAWAATGLNHDPTSMQLQSTATLQIGFVTDPAPASACQPVATGGYLGAENQLIRVQISSVDANGVPTIVWGYDDATFLYELKSAVPETGAGRVVLTLAKAPVDSYHYPVPGQVVELLRDAAYLTPSDPTSATADGFIAAAAGAVLVTEGYDSSANTVTVAASALPAGYEHVNRLYLRVWQGSMQVTRDTVVPLTSAGASPGVTITLRSEGGGFHPGDFWCFALRPSVPNLIYPARYGVAPQPPEGARVLACPLALVSWPDQGSPTVGQCVPAFDNLVELTANKGGTQGCCTVKVTPGDVVDTSLNTLLAPYAGTGPITVCFAPGTYTLSEPLMLDGKFNDITLESCGGPAVFEAAENPSAAFLRGLIVLERTRGATIRGIELTQPRVRFNPPQNAFAALSVATRNNANQSILDEFTRNMSVAIGITAQDTQGLTVKDCAFVLDIPEGALKENIYGAAIYATGSLPDATVSTCTFRTFPTPDSVPFYDLAAGNQPPFPWLLSFGYVQVPLYTSGDAAAQQLDLGLFHDCIIDHCRFEGLTVPVLVEGQLGTIRIDANTVQDCYGGIWLAALANSALATGLSIVPIGNAGIYREMASAGLAPYADPVMALAILVAQVLPTGTESLGRVLPYIDAESMTLASQALRGFLNQAATIAPVATGVPPAPATPAGPVSEAATSGPGDAVTARIPDRAAPQPGREAPAAAPAPARLSDILTRLPALDQVLTSLGAKANDFPADEDTGTSAVLRLTVTNAQVDAVVPSAYSGVGLLVGDQTTPPGSAVLTGNRIRNRCPSGFTAAVLALENVTVTGNIFANELSAGPNPANHSLSLVPRVNMRALSSHGDPTRSGSSNYVLPTTGTGQANWRWCNKCQDLFYGGSADRGVCPTGGNHADPAVSGSPNFFVPMSGNGQRDWRWCNKCQGLFWGDSTPHGVCPAGGNHADPAVSGSGNYVLPTAGAGESNWRWCNQCQGLFFAGGATGGICPATSARTPPVAIVGNVFVSAPILPDRPGLLPPWYTLNTEVTVTAK
jgi:hypothetical protein